VSLRIAKQVAFCLALTCILSAWCPHALALDPALDATQYGHTAWRVRDGFSNQVITAFAQTSDGYLWLGTLSGLQRFDGVRNVPWQPPAGSSLPHDHIRALLAARDGTLWIGTGGGLASWSGGRLMTHSRFVGKVVSGLLQDREGTVWVATNDSPSGVLCAIRDASTECYGEDRTLGEWATSLYEDGKGNLWAATENGIWRWRPGPPIRYSVPDAAVGSLQPITETATGAILVAARDGIWQIANGKVQAFPLPSLPRDAQPNTLLRDRDGAIWVGTLGGGVFHVSEGRMDTFGRLEGLSGDQVSRLFEDREGNIWLTTLGGIDRFRALAAVTYSERQTWSGVATSVVADRESGIWLSTANPSRLYRWRDGRIAEIAAEGLPDRATGSLLQDSHGRIWSGTLSGLGYLNNGRFVSVSGIPAGYIDGIAEDSEGNLWIAHRDAGLVRLARDRTVQQFPSTKIVHSGASAYRLVVDSVNGGLWLGFFSGALVHFVDGRVRASYSFRDGLGKGSVNHLRVGTDGAVWAATDGGLSRLKAGRIATLDSSSGLPCDRVDSTIVDDDASTWLYTSCGLVRIARADLDAWARAVDEGKATPRIRATILDNSDGVRGEALSGSWTPHFAKSRDGKLWFTTRDGVTMVDPRNLHTNTLPPLVHVGQVVADRKTYGAASQVHLPPLVRDLQIEYTALSFVAPEKVLFRYKLEGRDRDWQDAGNRRQAFYSDLDPGNYRFRVIASNNSGVWNEEGASLDFSIAPAYWQTTWFRALCVLAFIALLLALYLLRVRHLARRFNTTLDARVNERMRIARDLHDTLLQSFHGLLLRFQTAMDLLPNRATEAKQVLGSAIDQAADAITEGRDAVQGLRSSTMETNDLADAIRTVGEELAADEGANRGVVLRVEAQGAPRALHPIVRDEILRIAGEALRNAFRHAHAAQIEVELRYDERDLRLRVRDDGKGIDPKVLNRGGREGHFGMHGMRERTKLIGGKLTVWSGLDSGTEVELSIPAAHAYTSSSSSTWRSRLAEKLKRQGTTSDS
jgi:signal transduction histidine kinase/ligand-binding sensor domain-containing protein